MLPLSVLNAIEIKIILIIKGHLCSRNVGYHYKNYLFGCSDKELSFSVVFLRLEMGVPEMIFVYFIRRIVLYNTYITKQIYISVQVV